MRVAHFDCYSGISGDMTLGALVSAGVPAEAIQDGLASLKLPLRVEFESIRRGGFAAIQVRVEAPGEDEHRFLPDIEAILARGNLRPAQQTLALRIFRRLAEAEAAVHGIPVEKVHFHEVGALDSIADIVGSAIGLDLLGVERFTARPVPTGHGTVKAAHGVMPIPTPATAELLKGVPLAPSPIKAELTTPTGAAILTTLVNEWIPSPVMRIERIGYGAGHRDFVEQANLLRLFVGTADPISPQECDRIVVLETNLDDLPAEIVGYCMERLFAAGALDVFTQPILMKKNRPGILLTVLAPEVLVPVVEEILFAETTTFGIRRYAVERRKLQRKPHTVQTPFGPVQGKLGWLEGRPPTFAPEYEDCARIARERQVPLRQVYEAATLAFRREQET
ncbi:MAG: nickel pincer cofactor biosynthesis protein LarC [Gemmatales bacterium]|nr:nickel pincer cofactor biosynthesis protein LarC [Gemmatales bacterium]MDW8387281.1 nickel pincer cofactor biosynthesis protein LarC [Gemmatales bacterium]